MWQNLGLFVLGDKWRFTPPVDGEVFRLSHIFTGDITLRPRASIATGFIDDNAQVNVFNPKVFSYRQDYQIFNFTFPVGLPVHSLGFIRIDDISGNWIVKVEVFKSDSLEDDFANYLISRFGSTIPFLNTMAAHKYSLIPKSESVSVKKGFDAQILVNSNPNRALLNIRADRSPVYVWADRFVEIDGQQQPITILAEIEKGDDWDLPTTSDGIYKGAIYVQVTKNSDVDYTEYSYPQQETQETTS